MKKLSTIIVDDEPLALSLMRSYLQKHEQIEIVAECQNGKQAIEKALDLQPDLMFLDIQMPGLSGFDVIRGLQADIMPMVVFVTAYDRYALDAFDVHAVDYLLKPLDEEQLSRALDRSLQRRQSGHNSADDKAKLVGAIRTSEEGTATDSEDAPISEAASHDQKIVIKDRNLITLLEQSEIDWIDAAGDYMCVQAGGTTHIMRCTMKNLLTQLNPEIFKRVHRSTVVNLERIERIIPLPKGEYFIELGASGERIKVSRNFRGVILQYLSEQGG